MTKQTTIVVTGALKVKSLQKKTLLNQYFLLCLLLQEVTNHAIHIANAFNIYVGESTALVLFVNEV